MSTPSPATWKTCPHCADAYARGRDEARAEYQATYAENVPLIAARNYREGWLAAQAAPAGMTPPAWCLIEPPARP